MASIFSKKPKYTTLTPVQESTVKQPFGGTAPTTDGEQQKTAPHTQAIPGGGVDGLWDKCKECNELIFTQEREANLNLCPKCGYHYPLTAQKRIELLTDNGSFQELFSGILSTDPLEFNGVESYQEKLSSSKKKTGLEDAVVCGRATLNGIPYALAVMDFRFLGASMGAVVGEKITRLIEYGTANRLPVVVVTASGGARMYEGMISLMQMAKTSAAVERHGEAKLPYIVIMTHPTTAGVTASFASLGDLILAEPGALIGFAGRRVIKETTQAELPEGFQTAEFLLNKGLIDKIVDRKNLRGDLANCLDFFKSACSVNTEN